MDGFLLVQTGSLAGQRFALRQPDGPLTLGRAADCAVRFDPQRERMVGRRHARIELRPDGCFLRDEQSANGTFKDGLAIREARLQDGDRFQLGGEVDGAAGPWLAVQLPAAVRRPLTPDRTATAVWRPREDASTGMTQAGAARQRPAAGRPLGARVELWRQILVVALLLITAGLVGVLIGAGGVITAESGAADSSAVR
jgi:hypothetical protein